MKLVKLDDKVQRELHMLSVVSNLSDVPPLSSSKIVFCMAVSCK